MLTLPKRHLDVTVTSVCGHLMTIDFADKTQWRVNAAHCFEDRIVESVIKGSEDIYQNLANEAQRVQLIVVWTDCDREGEAIGAEIVRACQSTNPTVAIRRARFSAANQADLWYAPLPCCFFCWLARARAAHHVDAGARSIRCAT